ncbi:hypothetical protein GCM10022207_63640 [Streptomyces lannensis]|uniref:Uncharacterized protein n=1 Tax=Streptomyces lannensis TaxID=766498 RepID=A0ABP7KUF7_9ACTN
MYEGEAGAPVGVVDRGAVGPGDGTSTGAGLPTAPAEGKPDPPLPARTPDRAADGVVVSVRRQALWVRSSGVRKLWSRTGIPLPGAGSPPVKAGFPWVARYAARLCDTTTGAIPSSTRWTGAADCH